MKKSELVTSKASARSQSETVGPSGRSSCRMISSSETYLGFLAPCAPGPVNIISITCSSKPFPHLGWHKNSAPGCRHPNAEEDTTAEEERRERCVHRTQQAGHVGEHTLAISTFSSHAKIENSVRRAKTSGLREHCMKWSLLGHLGIPARNTDECLCLRRVGSGKWLWASLLFRAQTPFLSQPDHQICFCLRRR